MPGGTMATVTWDTDVPGTSVVDYGETTLYEIGTKADDELKTEHTVLLTGLTADTFYHLQITSVDEFGNTVSTEMCIRDRKRGRGGGQGRVAGRRWGLRG